jgi:hypothetical protein
LLQDILERGRAAGEFHHFDTAHTSTVVIAPMLFLIMSKNTYGICLAGSGATTPEDLIAQHADLIVRGLCTKPKT